MKKSVLPPDAFARDNIKYISLLGKKADDNDIVNIVRNDAIRQYVSAGHEYAEACSLADNYLQLPSTGDQMLMLLAGNNWYWGGRQVYRFDDTLAKLLSEQTKDDINLDVSAISQLPCNDFFIMWESSHSHGFFVSVTETDIIFAELQQEGKMDASFIPLQQGNIKDIIENTIFSECDVKDYADDIKHMAYDISQKMQFVIYLATINAEIVPVTKGAIARRAKADTSKAPSRAYKTEISNVGYRIGAAVRQSRYSYDKSGKSGERHGTRKAPHLRRSHFHSFWTGSGEKRKLVVKWVNTIFVNAGKGGSETTVHEVKKYE